MKYELTSGYPLRSSERFERVVAQVSDASVAYGESTRDLKAVADASAPNGSGWRLVSRGGAPAGCGIPHIASIDQHAGSSHLKTVVMNLQKWTQLSEIAAAIGVIVTLVILIQEVHTNTLAMRQQTLNMRDVASAEPFLNPEVLPGLYARVKAVDGGVDPDVEAFMRRYDMTAEEALQWTRHLSVLWRDAEAEFLVNGPTPYVEGFVGRALETPDLALFWETWGESLGFGFDPSFVAYVQGRSQQ